MYFVRYINNQYHLQLVRLLHYDQVATPGRTNLPFRIMSQVLISPSGYLQLASSQGCWLVGSIAAINTHSVWNY